MIAATDWDDAYANAPHIAGAEDFPPRWAAAAAAFRAAQPGARLDLASGPGDRERFDLFAPAGASAGLFVFVHGGYWKAFDKSFWSHLAAGALARGWAAALPSYPLAPSARIAEISEAVGAAIAAAAEEVAGPIRLAGHSAGGQIVTRLIAEGAPLAPEPAGAIERVVSISGLHDLGPLMNTTMNETLKIDAAEAAAESPARRAPLHGVDVVAWVGAEERPEFIRQTELLAAAWPNAAARIEPGRHHFDVIDGLADPESPLCRAIFD